VVIPAGIVNVWVPVELYVSDVGGMALVIVLVEGGTLTYALVIDFQINHLIRIINLLIQVKEVGVFLFIIIIVALNL